MDTANFSAIESYAKVSAFVLFLVGFAWTVWRTGSLYPLRRRVWQLVNGMPNFSDSEFQHHVSEREFLMWFRWHTGIRARTARQAVKLLDALKHHDEDIVCVGRAGSLFELDRLRLKDGAETSAKRYLWAYSSASVFAMLATTWTVSGAGAREAWLQLKETGNGYLVTKTAARKTGLLGWRSDAAKGLGVETCNSETLEANAQALSIPLRDAEILCSILKDPKTPAYLAKTLSDQRIAFGLLTLYFVTFFLHLFVRALHAWHTRDFASRLKEKLGNVNASLDPSARST